MYRKPLSLLVMFAILCSLIPAGSGIKAQQSDPSFVIPKVISKKRVIPAKESDAYFDDLEQKKRSRKKIDWKNPFFVSSSLFSFVDEFVSVTNTKRVSSSVPEPVFFIDSKHPVSARIQKVLTSKQTKNQKVISNFSNSSSHIKFKTPKKSIFSKLQNWFFPRVSAREGTPIFSLEERKTGSLFDTLLYDLGQMQQENGSFGKQQPVRTTVAVVEALESWNLTRSTGYADALTFLEQVSPQVTVEQASQVMFFKRHNIPFEEVFSSILEKQNPDGGFGYAKSYQSDLLTTLSVIDMMIEVQEQPDLRMTRALLFVLKNISDTGAVSTDGEAPPSYFLSTRVLETLFPLREQVLETGEETLIIEEMINRVFNFIESSYNPSEETFSFPITTLDSALLSQIFDLYNRNSSWVFDMNEKVPSSDFQETEHMGPFTLLQVLLATANPDLEVVSLTPRENWVHGSPAIFDVTLKNRGYKTIKNIQGNIFIDHIFFETIEDMFSDEVEILPGQEVSIEITLQDTSGFVGSTSVDFFAIVSRDADVTNNMGSFLIPVESSIERLPALPLFLVAHKMVSAGLPAINVRWNKKFDPNRQNYIIRYRQKGSSSWQSVAVSNEWSGAILGNLLEGEEYEIVVGVQQHNGTVFVSDTPIDIWVSADEGLYTVTSSVQVVGLQPKNPVFLENYGTSTLTRQNGTAVLSTGNGINAAWIQMPAYEAYKTLYKADVGEMASSSSSFEVFASLKLDEEPPILSSVIPELRSGQVTNQQSVRISVRGQDNIALKDIELYYYEPTQNEWIYIATTEPNLINGGDFFWYIPPHILGPGYKIRSIVSDFQGNRSAPLDSSSFTILEGSSPHFDITLRFNGVSSSLGQPLEIEWNTDSAHPVSKVSLEVIHQQTGFVKQIAKNIPNTGSFVWGIPFDSAFAGNGFQIRIRGKDSQTLVSGEAESSYFSITDPSVSSASPWEAPLRIEDDVSDVLALQYDVSGTAYMVYKTYPEISFEDMNGQVAERLWYRSLKQGQWSEPFVLYDNLYRENGDTWSAPSIRNLQVAVDASSTLHILWESNVPGGCQGENEKEIWYMQGIAHNFSAPINISQNTTISEGAKLLADTKNQVHVAWTDGNSFDQNCRLQGNRSVWMKTFTNNEWGQSVSIPNTEQAFSLELIETPNGQIHMVFFDAQTQSLVHRIQGETGWNDENILPVQEFFVPTIDVASDSSSTLFVAYEHEGREGTNIWLSTISELGWSIPERIVTSSEGWSTHDPKILLDREDNLQVIFAQEQDGPFIALSRSLFSTQKNRENLWTSPQKISLDSQKIQQDTIQFGFSQNQLVAAYVAPYQQKNALFSVSRQQEDISSEPQPIKNLILDGDMESEGIDAWRSWKKNVIFEKSSSSFAGDYAMYLQSLGRTSGFQQLNIPVEPTKRYRYSFRYKLLSGRVESNLGIKNSNKDFEGKKAILNFQNTEWQTYSREFTVPESFVNDFRVVVRIRNGEGYIDDVVLQEISEPLPGNNNLVEDGNMKGEGLGPWLGYRRPVTLEKTSSTQFEGTQSLHLVVGDTASGVQQRYLPVEGGHRYRLSFAYQVLGTFMPRLGINTSNRDFEFPVGASRPLITSTPKGEWALYEREFTVPENFEGDFRLVFNLLSKETYSRSNRRDLPFGELFLNDVQIVEIP